MEKDAEGFYTATPESKPEAPPEQEDSAYLGSFYGLGGPAANQDQERC